LSALRQSPTRLASIQNLLGIVDFSMTNYMHR
jgi:hypothetical protein